MWGHFWGPTLVPPDVLPGLPVLIPSAHNFFPEICNSQASQAELTFCLAGLCTPPALTIFSGKFEPGGTKV